MVTLKTMSSENFDRWWENIWITYREELIRSGVAAKAADENVAETKASAMTDGRLASGHFAFDVFDDEQLIGVVWLHDDGEEWFIFDIEIVESQRGRGLGRATMRAIEQHVRDQGGNRIALSVFAFNEVAHRLYLSEGYETSRYSMLKKLS